MLGNLKLRNLTHYTVSSPPMETACILLSQLSPELMLRDQATDEHQATSFHHKSSLDWKVYQRLSQNGKQISTLFWLPEEISSLFYTACRYRSAKSPQCGGVEEAEAPQKQAVGPRRCTELWPLLPMAWHSWSFAFPGHPELLVAFPVSTIGDIQASASKGVCNNFVGLSAVFIY